MSHPPKLSPTSFAMLGLLARKPQSAYELNTIMQTSLIRVFWPRAESHVYSEPKKLLLHNFVTDHKEQVSGRNRTVYTITELGRDSLRTWLRSEENPELRMQSELMLKLILADGGTVTNASETIEQSSQASQKDLREAVAGVRLVLSDTTDRSEGMPYNGIAVNLMADMLIARLKWSEFATQWISKTSDGSGSNDRRELGRAAYAEALLKMERALDD